MEKQYCDCCERLIEEGRDVRTLSITKGDGKNAVTPKEICVFCMIDINGFIGKLGKEVEK